MRGALAILLIGITLGSVLVVGPDPAEATDVPNLPVLGLGSEPVAPPPQPMDAPFGANVRASEDDTPGNQNEITMAVASDGRIHMGWNDYRQPNPDYRCGYSYSTDGGLTWSPNRLLHLPGWDADGDPVVIVDSNNAVYFICMPFSRTGGGSRVVVYKSTDGGATFVAPVTASDTTNGFNDKPWAHAVGTTLHVCYANFAGSVELRYTRSTDGGVTWDPTRILDTGGNGCVFASTASGMLYLAWVRGGGIYALSSANGGTTWSAPRFVGAAPFTNAGDQRAGPLPMIAADWNGGNVYIVWTANDGAGSWDVRFSRSTDFGVTWSAPMSVNDVIANRQFMPGIGVDGAGTVHVSWYDNRTGRMTYRYSYSTDGGLTWAPSLRVTDLDWVTSFFIGDYTALVADAQGYVNCGWADVRTGEVEAFFARAQTSGPPILTQIDVTPPEAWTDADTPVLFAATGYNQFGQPYPINPTWEATGGFIGGGLYTPQRAGDWTVWANESGVSGSAIVHVAAGALARIDVTPPDATIPADDTQAYAATGYDSKGNTVAVSPTWGVTDGAIDGAGLFTPRRVGTWTVYANASGVSGFTSVVVTPGALARIFVSPPTATITADDVLPYTATGYDAKDNVVAIAPLWAAGGGTIDVAGLYVAQLVGTWGVYAEASGVSGSASVTVTAGALATIDVIPKDLVITADQTVPYTASGYDADGNAVAIAPSWSVGAGSIDASGVYTPGPVGTYVVTASVGTVSGGTSVTVRPGPLARIDVIPPTATISADDLLPLTAEGYDVRGNRLAISPTWAATCGSVDATGLYTPGPARLCIVYANESGISGSAAVTVVVGRLARIDVIPPMAEITADETVQFTAIGYDAKDNAVAIAPAWSAIEGSIDATGLYAPRFAGAWEVRATVSPVVGTATVAVTPGALVGIDVQPPVATVRADRTQQFTATGRDAKGNALPLTAPVWSVGNGAVVAGLFTPVRVGLWTVSASESGLTGTAAATVTPGAVDRVEITPGESRVGEGQRVAFTAVAFDVKGNPVPDATMAWRVEGGIGTVNRSGGLTATRGGTGRVVVTATDGEASASASAPVLVDGSPVAYLPWILAAVLVPLFLFVVWRRRRKGPPPPRV